MHFSDALREEGLQTTAYTVRALALGNSLLLYFFISSGVKTGISHLVAPVMDTSPGNACSCEGPQQRAEALEQFSRELRHCAKKSFPICTNLMASNCAVSGVALTWWHTDIPAQVSQQVIIYNYWKKYLTLVFQAEPGIAWNSPQIHNRDKWLPRSIHSISPFQDELVPPFQQQWPCSIAHWVRTGQILLPLLLNSPRQCSTGRIATWAVGAYLVCSTTAFMDKRVSQASKCPSFT